jgi:hypothetical protein
VSAVIVASLTVYEDDNMLDYNPNDANYGAVVDLFAPGDNIIGAWPSSNPNKRDVLAFKKQAWGGVAGLLLRMWLALLH